MNVTASGSTGAGSTGDEAGAVRLSVVRGSPTAAEVAALVVVLSTLPGQAAMVSPRVSRYGWSDRSRSQRAPIVPGPGAWRASGLPQ